MIHLFDTPTPGLTSSPLVLGILLFSLICLVTLLIVVIETTVMTLMRWGTLRQSLTASLLVNIVSTIVVTVLTTLILKAGYLLVFIGWALSVLLEGWMLNAIHHQSARKNWLAAVVANTVSYLLLILPAFYFGQRA